MKSRFMEKLLTRLDRLDPDSVQTQFLRLAHEKGLMETIFHAIQEGIIVLDGASRMIYANRAAEKLLGFSLEEASGDLISRHLREVEWDRILNLDETEWTQLISREIETNYPEHRFLDFYVVPLQIVDPNEKGAVVFLRDITRERENEAQVIESERLRALTLLAASVAHEIGNPLNSLNIHLQLIRREMGTLPEEHQAYMTDLLEVATHEVSRLDQIIHQFLGALRPMQPDMVSTCVDTVLTDTLQFMKTEITDRDVDVDVAIPEKLPRAMADPGQLRQAFFNILKNAIQAMPGGGLLKIRLSETDRFVAVAFSDAGPGISPWDLGAIFEPYHTTKPGGSGLGLMIVQRIIRDHGGEIEVISEPDRGTTITLFIPREDRKTRLLKAPRSASATHEGEMHDE
ncbi:MAG: PAS domain-containing protein [Spartobacteria bacterium]|nr:PAS domain-containing protein [Spartobacteria bacterium]